MPPLPNAVVAFGTNHFVEKFFQTGSGLIARCFFVVVTAKNPPLFQIKPLFAVKSCTNRLKNALFVAKCLVMSKKSTTFATQLK